MCPIYSMNAMRAPLAVTLWIATSASAFAAPPEPPPGASSCSGCHAAGRGVDTAVPPLLGRPAADIAAQMQAFKTGQKPSTVMDRIAKGFTDAEIGAIADWYAHQK
jgi:cytochrome subunit of sulfide dehydrogenase